MIWSNHRCLAAIACIFSALEAGLAVAEEVPFSFRGIALGASPSSVHLRAEKEFENVASKGNLIVGSDKNGAGLDGCPLFAIGTKLPCLQAKFLFENLRGEDRLSLIKVEQSFSPPVASETILKKLQDAYGQERRRYHHADIVSIGFQSDDDLGLLWGGKNVPAPPFRPQTVWLYLDFEKIGGQYITAVINNVAGKATGYQLQIVDADRLDEAKQEAKAKEERERINKERERRDSLRF